MLTLRFAFFLACIAGISTVTSAQTPISPPSVYNTGTAGLLGDMVRVYHPVVVSSARNIYLEAHKQPNRGRVSRPIGKAGSQPGTSPAPPAGTATSSPVTVFHTVEPAFVPRQLAERLGKTSQERQYIEDVLTKCLNFYTETAAKSGPLHDVARALSYYISTNYYVYVQGAGPTREQMIATRDSIRANMAQDENFRRMSDRQKQEAYEALIVIAGFVDLGYGTAKKSGNESLAAKFREMAKYNLESALGVPVDKIHFTNDGLAFN